MSDKTKEEIVPEIGDLLPYTNTHSKICIGKVTSIKPVDSGKKWWYGIDTTTGAQVFYPVRTSLYLKAYADQEKRKEAIAYARWVTGKFHDCGDGTFIILTGGGQLTLEEVYDLFQSLPKQ